MYEEGRFQQQGPLVCSGRLVSSEGNAERGWEKLRGSKGDNQRVGRDGGDAAGSREGEEGHRVDVPQRVAVGGRAELLRRDRRASALHQSGRRNRQKDDRRTDGGSGEGLPVGEVQEVVQREEGLPLRGGPDMAREGLGAVRGERQQGACEEDAGRAVRDGMA